jgi:hypothetical protein
MKAFRFPLESAHRWRELRRDLEASKTAVAEKRLNDIRATRHLLRQQLTDAFPRAQRDSGEGAFFDNWIRQTQAALVRLEEDSARALAELNLRRQALLEAERAFRVLEEFRKRRHAEWSAALAREEDSFAGEAFLNRLQSERRGA